MIGISYGVTSQENNTTTELFLRFSDTNQSNDIKSSHNLLVIKLHENTFEASYWPHRAASTYQNSANTRFQTYR